MVPVAFKLSKATVKSTKKKVMGALGVKPKKRTSAEGASNETVMPGDTGAEA